VSNWGEPLRRRIVLRAVQRGELDAARVAAHDETWAAARDQLRPLYDRFRGGRRKRDWRTTLIEFIREYWDDILRILLALLPLILEAGDGGS